MSAFRHPRFTRRHGITGPEVPPGQPDHLDEAPRRAPGKQGWPTGPLDAAQRAFDLLTCPPAPLAFDCRGMDPAHLPQRIVPLDQLRRILLLDQTPRPVRDLVWAELVTRARRDGPAWVIAAAGMALPGLRARARFLTGGLRRDRDDMDSELLLGFLERLKTIDVDAGNIASRLIDAGARRARKAHLPEEAFDIAHPGTQASLPPARPWDHPDFVLARAVAAAVIGPEECALIGATRLDDVPMREMADWLGVSVSTASSWRRRAELLLAAAIADGELRWTGLSPAR